MKKIFSMAMMLLTMGMAISSCSSDDDATNEKVTVVFQAAAPSTDDAVISYEGFTLTLTSQRDGSTKTATLDKDGKATITVDRGSYNATISGVVNDKEYYGSIDATQFNESKSQDVSVKHIVSAYSGSMKGLVISEIFYNGGTYAGKMQHPDQYIVLANNSDHDIKVDGLCICQASNMNSLPCSTLTDLLPDFVAAANIYQIPVGANQTIKAGEVMVIARSAINHAETLEYKDGDTGIPADLSGADMELAENMANKTVDNPEVPNLTKICNTMEGGVTGWMHPYGIRPMFVFDGSDINWDTFKQNNCVTYNEKANIKSEIAEYNGYYVPTRLIIDGVESTSETTPYWGGFSTKSLPSNVDKSHVQATIEGCHHNTYMYRKQVSGKYQDTDDSSADMVIEHRQDFKGYPKGWRSSK